MIVECGKGSVVQKMEVRGCHPKEMFEKFICKGVLEAPKISRALRHLPTRAIYMAVMSLHADQITSILHTSKPQFYAVSVVSNLQKW